MEYLNISKQISDAKRNGPFSDIYDCFGRLYISGVGKKTFEDLIYADVFKEFGYNRATLVYNLDSLFNYAELTKDIDPSLVIKPEIENQKDFSKNYILEKEKEVFGFYFSSHPVTMYKKSNPYCVSLYAVDSYFGKTIDALVLVEKIKIISTKKGEKMAFLTGSDETGSKEFIMFPKIYKSYLDVGKGDLLKIRGRIEKRLDEYQIIVERLKKLEVDDNE